MNASPFRSKKPCPDNVKPPGALEDSYLTLFGSSPSWLQMVIRRARENWHLISAISIGFGAAVGVLSQLAMYILLHIPFGFMRSEAIFRAGVSGVAVTALIASVFFAFGVTTAGFSLAVRYRLLPYSIVGTDLVGARLLRNRLGVLRWVGGLFSQGQLMCRLRSKYGGQLLPIRVVVSRGKAGFSYFVVYTLTVSTFLAVSTFSLRAPWLGGGALEKVILYGAPEVLNAHLQHRMRSWKCREDGRVVTCEGVLLASSDDKQTLVADDNLDWHQISSDKISIGRGR